MCAKTPAGVNPNSQFLLPNTQKGTPGGVPFFLICPLLGALFVTGFQSGD